MFRGTILGVWYYSWNDFKAAYNKAVVEGMLFDENGRKITKPLD